MKKSLFWLLTILTSNLISVPINYVSFDQICRSPYTQGAILRKDPLFVDDFLVLHCLLQQTKPNSIFEIGTCTGEGTLIIKNAIKGGKVYSLDLPPGQSSYDLPQVGNACYLPYHQIFGNSLEIEYEPFYPIEAWFIDGAHEYRYVLYETKKALLSSPRIIIWHDADIPEVLDAIVDGLDDTFSLFRVQNTRIAFAVPKKASK